MSLDFQRIRSAIAGQKRWVAWQNSKRQKSTDFVIPEVTTGEFVTKGQMLQTDDGSKRSANNDMLSDWRPERRGQRNKKRLGFLRNHDGQDKQNWTNKRPRSSAFQVNQLWPLKSVPVNTEHRISCDVPLPKANNSRHRGRVRRIPRNSVGFRMLDGRRQVVSQWSQLPTPDSSPFRHQWQHESPGMLRSAADKQLCIPRPRFMSALGVERPNTGKGLTRNDPSLTRQMARLDSPGPATAVAFPVSLAMFWHGWFQKVHHGWRSDNSSTQAESGNGSGLSNISRSNVGCHWHRTLRGLWVLVRRSA